MVSVMTEVLELKRLKLRENITSWAAGAVPRYPWRRQGVNAYQVMVGEMLLKRAAPPVAVWVYHTFLQHFPSFDDFTRITEEELDGMLACFGIGKYTRELSALAVSLAVEGRGDLPRDSESLGRIANLDKHSVQAVMCFGYDLPVVVIDSHSARMLGRIFERTLPINEYPGLAGALGEALLPDRNSQLFSQGLLELAEMVCLAEEPLCPQCPVAEVCDYRENFCREAVRWEALPSLFAGLARPSMPAAQQRNTVP